MPANNAIRLETDPIPLIDNLGSYSLVVDYVRGYWDGVSFTVDVSEYPFATSQVYGPGNTVTGTSVVHGLLTTLIGQIQTAEGFTALTLVNGPGVTAGSIWHT